MFLTNTMYSQSAHADPAAFTVSVMHNGSKTMPDADICISGGGQCVNAKAADIDFLIKALNAIKEDLQRFPLIESIKPQENYTLVKSAAKWEDK